MTTVLIVIHLMVVLAMIALVLLQRSEGGALGMGGGGGGGMMTGLGVGNLLTRTTGILAVAFFATSIGLTVIARLESNPTDVLDSLPGSESAVQTPVQQPETGGQVQTPPSAGGSVLEGLREQSGLGSTPQSPPGNNDTQ